MKNKIILLWGVFILVALIWLGSLFNRAVPEIRKDVKTDRHDFMRSSFEIGYMLSHKHKAKNEIEFNNNWLRDSIYFENKILK